MKWFRVEDAPAQLYVLVEAESVEEACRIYMEEVPPDLSAAEASADEIADWKLDPSPQLM